MQTPKSPIELVLLDVDGVFTDGTVLCSANGEEEKFLYMPDVDAVFEARRRGALVGLVTGEETPWVDFIARRLAVQLVVKGAKDKLAAVRQLAETEGVALDRVCYVGDSDRDAPALAAVGLGLAPSDASPEARRAAAAVLSSSGGRGAVAEAIRLALRWGEPAANVTTQIGAGLAADDAAAAAIRGMIGESVAVQQAVAQTLAPNIFDAARVVARGLGQGGKVLIFGNGGSAADAEHMAAELVGRFERERPGLPALALTANSSVLTALGNDFGQEEVFARQVEALGKAGDVAVAISTSGRSPNVVAAARRARALGLSVVALTGAGGGDLRPLADVCVSVPSSSVARIQEAHRVVIHSICSVVDDMVVHPQGQAHK
jgi:D-sedoheptulose 7-phosphate isomerase